MTQFEKGYSADSTANVPVRSRSGATDPPTDFGPGTEGPAVTPIIKWMIGYAARCGRSNTGLIADTTYGPTFGQWIFWYRKQHGLPLSQDIDADALAQMKRDGFDFAAEAQATDPGEVTVFERDARFAYTTVYWASGCPPCSSRSNLLVYVRRN